MNHYEQLAVRVTAIEEDNKSIKELIGLLDDVKGALRLFVKVGKVIKWISTILLAVSGIAWALKHFGVAP